MSTDRAQRVHEKNWVILLVMLTARIMFFKILKMAQFFVFSPEYSKNSVPLFQSASERSYLALLENTMNYWVRSYH